MLDSHEIWYKNKRNVIFLISYPIRVKSVTEHLHTAGLSFYEFEECSFSESLPLLGGVKRHFVCHSLALASDSNEILLSGREFDENRCNERRK